MKNFRTYQLAKELYFACKALPLKGELRDQLHRATLSIVLNLAEGSGKMTLKDQQRFYTISFGSLRETQALLEILSQPKLSEKADAIGGGLWKLIRRC